jgi:hypothetical protein
VPRQTHLADRSALARRLAAEGLGAFFLFATVIGSGIMAENLFTRERGDRVAGQYACDRAMLFVLITMMGPISGAHMNPAVSLVAAARRELSWKEAGAYRDRPDRSWHRRRMGGASHVRPAGAAAFGEGADRAWPMTGEAIATFGLILTSRHDETSAGMGPGQRRALYHGSLLVHLLDQLRQSGDHHRPAASPTASRALPRGRAHVSSSPSCSARAGGADRALPCSMRNRHL